MPGLQKYSEPFYSGSVIDYGRNWGDSEKGDKGFLQEGEIITSSTWVITATNEDPVLLVQDAQGTGISADKQKTSIFLTDGTAGVRYELENTIETLTTSGNTRQESKIGVLDCCAKK